MFRSTCGRAPTASRVVRAACEASMNIARFTAATAPSAVDATAAKRYPADLARDGRYQRDVY